MCPLVGYYRPSSILTVVDLPEPFGPSKPKTSPRRTSKSTSSTAFALGRPQKSLKIFVRPRTATMVSAGWVWRVADCGLSTAVITSTRLSRLRRQFRHRLSFRTRAFASRFRRDGLERLQFFAQPHEAGAVEHHDQGAGVVQNRRDDRVQVAEGAGRPAADDKANAEQEILIDDGPRLTRQLHEERQPAQIIVHERDGRAMDGHFAARRTHRDAHVARGQRRRVVHAVSHHSDAIAAAFHFTDKLHFVL